VTILVVAIVVAAFLAFVVVVIFAASITAYAVAPLVWMAAAIVLESYQEWRGK
jgi:hypothetical protein